MNLLAHAYLSFGIPEILVGNLISDYVKGRKKFGYPEGIQKGIALHRYIDIFTDHHPATKEAKMYFRDAYGLYAGAFVDIVYDHFLANDPLEFPAAGELSAFSQRCYAMLDPFQAVFPERFRVIFAHMKKHDWLYHYRFREGIHNSFAGLVRRAAYMDDYREAIAILENHYDRFHGAYRQFFPELKAYAGKTLDTLWLWP